MIESTTQADTKIRKAEIAELVIKGRGSPCEEAVEQPDVAP
jgi:hypothetical protein